MASLYRSFLRAGSAFPVRPAASFVLCHPRLLWAFFSWYRLGDAHASPPHHRTAQDYNVRDYVLRRTRQEFRRNRALTGPALAAALQHVRGLRLEARGMAASAPRSFSSLPRLASSCSHGTLSHSHAPPPPASPLLFRLQSSLR